MESFMSFSDDSQQTYSYIAQIVEKKWPVKETDRDLLNFVFECCNILSPFLKSSSNNSNDRKNY